jgi:hypothetical protein
VEDVTPESLMNAIFCPGVTAIISRELLGIMVDVVILAVGFVPI